MREARILCKREVKTKKNPKLGNTCTRMHNADTELTDSTQSQNSAQARVPKPGQNPANSCHTLNLFVSSTKTATCETAQWVLHTSISTWAKVSGTEAPGGYMGILKSTRGCSLMSTNPTKSHPAVHASLPVIATQYRNSKHWLCKLHPAWLISISSAWYKTTCTASRWDSAQKQSNYIYTALHTSQFDACNQLAISVSLHNLQLKSKAETGAHS